MSQITHGTGRSQRFSGRGVRLLLPDPGLGPNDLEPHGVAAAGVPGAQHDHFPRVQVCSLLLCACTPARSSSGEDPGKTMIPGGTISAVAAVSPGFDGESHLNEKVTVTVLLHRVGSTFSLQPRRHLSDTHSP